MLRRLPLARFLFIRPFILQEFGCHFLRSEKVFESQGRGIYLTAHWD